MWLISKGRFDLFGFTKEAYEFSPSILLWVLPMAVITTVGAITSHGSGASGPPGFTFTKLQTIVFVWGYASICEEIFVRGLLQTLLSSPAQVDAAAHQWLSMPVLVSGLFFGAMHILAFKRMGLAAVPVILLITFLGLVAAHYREKTGSLIPSIIIHALFNIGGSLPLWVTQWLRG
jgi:membrane protease YdiL (CAAX protease family)